MRFIKGAAGLLTAAFLFGCAATPPQTPIQFAKSDALKDASISVSMTEIDTPSMVYPGADCLLCLGVAAAANSTLSGYTKTLPTDDLSSLGQELVSKLTEKGLQVTLVDEPFSFKGLKKSTATTLNSARKDFTALKSNYKTTHLLVIDLPRVGVTRTYASYVPTSVPYVNVSGTAFLVNLETNALDWYQPLEVTLYAEGEWNEPDEFPSLTNSYFESVERIREKVFAAIEEI